MYVGLWDTVNLYNSNDEYVTFTIGRRGLIFYASKFKKVETAKEAIKVLKENGLHVKKSFVLA